MVRKKRLFYVIKVKLLLLMTSCQFEGDELPIRRAGTGSSWAWNCQIEGSSIVLVSKHVILTIFLHFMLPFPNNFLPLQQC